MPTAREILDERLARGEISAHEHETLAARLGAGSGASPSTGASTLSLTKGSKAMNIAGVVVALAWMGLTSNVVNGMIDTCMQGGRTEAMCRASGINWPMVYGSYIIAIVVGLSSLAALVLAKRSGTTGSAAR